jgi:hypothetical protein
MIKGDSRISLFMTRKTKRQGREKAHEAQLIKLIEREREREREELIRTS